MPTRREKGRSSIATLSSDTGLSERTVQYKLRSLEEAGVIRRGNQVIAAAYISHRDHLADGVRPLDGTVQRLHAGANDDVTGANHDVTGATDDTTGCNGCTRSVT
ncbi:winged helix-turn-helix transcriptional regulator [Pseudomonas aeruginosa]